MKLINQAGNTFEVEGDSGTTYTVSLAYPISCTCRDFTHRKNPAGLFCKHIKYVLREVENGNNKNKEQD